MTGAVSGRMAQTAVPLRGLEHKAFVPNKDTVYILDRKLSILMLDFDPGEGNSVYLPYEEKTCRTTSKK